MTLLVERQILPNSSETDRSVLISGMVLTFLSNQNASIIAIQMAFSWHHIETSSLTSEELFGYKLSGRSGKCAFQRLGNFPQLHPPPFWYIYSVNSAIVPGSIFFRPSHLILS